MLCNSCTSHLTSVVSVWVHDFGSHLDFGGLSVCVHMHCVRDFGSHRDLSGLSVCMTLAVILTLVVSVCVHAWLW